MGKPRQKIYKSTLAQERQLPAYCQKWKEIGLSTAPSDRKKAEEGVRLVYAAAGLPAPKRYFWFNSPYEGARTIARRWRLAEADKATGYHKYVVPKGACPLKDINHFIWNNLLGVFVQWVGEELLAITGAPFKNVWAEYWAVECAERDRILDEEERGFDSRLIELHKPQVEQAIGEEHSYALYWGMRDCWLGIFDYFLNVFKLPLGRMEGLVMLAQSCGWCRPFKDGVIFVERPCVLSLDDSKRLHNETGAALQYPDGEGVWAWHGIRVERWVIEEPKKITPAAIFSENNTEIRRAMRNIYGTARLMKAAGAYVLDTCEAYGARLLAMRLPYDPAEICMLELTDPSSGEVYHERVPPTIKTAREALAWRIRIKPSAYEPEFGT